MGFNQQPQQHLLLGMHTKPTSRIVSHIHSDRMNIVPTLPFSLCISLIVLAWYLIVFTMQVLFTGRDGGPGHALPSTGWHRLCSQALSTWVSQGTLFMPVKP